MVSVQVSTKYIRGINNFVGFVKLSLLLAFFSLLVISLWISYQMAYGLYFGKDFSITNFKHPPSLLLPKQIAATEKGDVYVVWVDKNTTSGDSDIEFISSNDSGKTFNRKELSGGDLLSFSPQIAATEKGDVYVVWVDKNSTSGDSNVSLSSSNDSGKTFNRKELSGGDLLSFSPQIAATEKGDVYVVWVDKNTTSGDSDIEFISSNDSGKTFNRKELSGGDLLSFSPQIAATEKGDVYVVWVDKNSTSGDSDIEFISSNDSGKTFNRKELSGGDLLSFSPQIAATEKGDVYVVWVDKNTTSGDSNVSLSSSYDSGLEFNNRINPSIDKKKYFRSYLNFSAQDVNQLHSKVYYFDSEKKEVKVDFIFGGRNGTFEDSITNLLPVPSNTSFIKLQMWVHQNPMNDSSYFLYDTKAPPTIQEKLTWKNDNADTQSASLYGKGNNSLKVDVTQGNETHWSVISTDFIPVDMLTLSTPITPQIAATEKGDVYVVWGDKNSTYLAFSGDHQNKFGSKVLLSDANRLTSYPRIAATEKGDMYVVWVESNVGFKEILDKGAILGETIVLTNNTRLSLSPQIVATEKGDLFAIWIGKNEKNDDGVLTFKRISKSFTDLNT